MKCTRGAEKSTRSSRHVRTSSSANIASAKPETNARTNHHDLRRLMCALEIHTGVENRIGVPRPDRERHRQLKTLLLESFDAYSDRLLLPAILGTVPYGACVVENLENSIAIINRPVHDVRTAQRVEVKLVPSAQGFRIAQHEPVVQRRGPVDVARQKSDIEMIVRAAERIARLGRMPRIHAIRFQEPGPR